MMIALFHTLLRASSEKGYFRRRSDCRNTLQSAMALTIVWRGMTDLARPLPA
jgi:hypothetical protein